MIIRTLVRTISNMDSHFQESNEIFEGLINKKCYPDTVFAIIKSIQGVCGFGVIWTSLFINSINKKGQDDFMTILAKDTKDLSNNVNSFLFFSTMSIITLFVFGLENLFKRILEDKGIITSKGFANIIKKIEDICELSNTEKDILYILKEMRNSYHGNIKFQGKRNVTLTIDNYTYSYNLGSPTIHLEDYSSKIILESVKIIRIILEKQYPLKK